MTRTCSAGASLPSRPGTLKNGAASVKVSFHCPFLPCNWYPCGVFGRLVLSLIVHHWCSAPLHLCTLRLTTFFNGASPHTNGAVSSCQCTQRDRKRHSLPHRGPHTRGTQAQAQQKAALRAAATRRPWRSAGWSGPRPGGGRTRDRETGGGGEGVPPPEQQYDASPSPSLVPP